MGGQCGQFEVTGQLFPAAIPSFAGSQAVYESGPGLFVASRRPLYWGPVVSAGMCDISADLQTVLSLTQPS